MTPTTLIDHGMTWYDVVRPTESELKVLAKKHRFHELDIEDCLSEHERPKLESYDEYLFIVFHIAYGTAGGRMLKAEVNIFVGESYLVTVHDGNLDILSDLRQELQKSEAKRRQYMDKGTGFFLYRLMEHLFESGFPLVEGITKKLRRLEDTLFAREEGPEAFREVLTIKRNIITMRSILLPQRTLVAAIQHQGTRFLGQHLQPYFDDILDAIERQWSLLDSAKELSEALHDTQESWLTFKTNAVVRALTVVSVTLLPLNIVSGLYGMNVPLPYQENALAFWAIVIVMGAMLFGIIGYSMYRKWL